MIRTQNAAACPGKLLIGSDLPDTFQARRELEQWARQNGYRLAKGNRSLSVFEHGALVREWVLLESAPRFKWAFPPHFRLSFKRRNAQGQSVRSDVDQPNAPLRIVS